MISVIVPVYNVQEYLDQCVESIVGQSYKDLEIILVDDGSTDESGRLCDIWAEKDNRIKVIHQKNGGLSAARNTGIKHACGEYISFIDSDDFILPDYFLYLLSLLKDNDADISVCQTIEVDEKGKIIDKRELEEDYVLTSNYECMKDFLSSSAIDTTAWRKLYKFSLFKDNGIFYPEGKYHEDVFTTYKVIGLSERIAVGAAALYAYRKRTGSIVNSNFSNKHLDGIRGKIERLEYIQSNFTQLYPLAASGVISSANQCLQKIISSNSYPKEAIKYLQDTYKAYGKYYLKTNRKWVNKTIVFCSMINLNALISIARGIKRIKK